MRDSSRRREASGGLQFLEYSLPFLSYLSPNRLPSHLSPSHFTRSAFVLMPKSFQADERPYHASHSARRSGRGASQPEVTLPRLKDGNRLSKISHCVLRSLAYLMFHHMSRWQKGAQNSWWLCFWGWRWRFAYVSWQALGTQGINYEQQKVDWDFIALGSVTATFNRANALEINSRKIPACTRWPLLAPSTKILAMSWSP